MDGVRTWPSELLPPFKWPPDYGKQDILKRFGFSVSSFAYMCSSVDYRCFALAAVVRDRSAVLHPQPGRKSLVCLEGLWVLGCLAEPLSVSVFFPHIVIFFLLSLVLMQLPQLCDLLHDATIIIIYIKPGFWRS